jgi:hypothetical protein
MSNILDNGTVLPFGLLGASGAESVSGFNKTYRNYPLRMGIVARCYPIDDPNNSSKLTNEYDVLVFEQQEDLGSTIITYKNCLSADGLGSIADFFEKTFRVREATPENKEFIDIKNQNGAIVLLLCLDGVSERGIIIGAITHPDRKTTIQNAGPKLEGEFNGLNVKIENDGSATLTFKGATDNYGKPKDSAQGDTEVKIEKDGSLQASHDSITQRYDRNGKSTLTTKDDISNNTNTNFNIAAKQNISMSAQKDFSLSSNNATMNAQGSATIMCQSFNLSSQSSMSMTGDKLQIEATSLAGVKAPQITLDGLVYLGGQGGQPVLLMTTVMAGVGNLGAIVLSTPIYGFANKVYGQ